jgi:hypothetical protein
MRGKGRLALFSICLAVVVALAHGIARSQAPSSAAATPLQIRQVAYLKASNPSIGAHFGCGGSLPGHIGNSIAISSDGTTLAIGAPHENGGARGVNGNQNDESAYGSGAVYLFTRRGDSWAQQAYIKASNPGPYDNFGLNVALSADGNTLAVAAYWEASAAKGINGNQNDDSIPQAGAVYVFTRRGATWSQQAYLKASNTGRAAIDDNDFGDGDQFGFTLALSADGNTLAAGAVAEDSRAGGINNLAFQDDDSLASSGAVYVFARTGATWSQQAYIKPSNSEGNDLFGYSVGLSGDGNSLVVGAFNEDGSGRTVNAIPDNRATGGGGSGAVYLFERQGATWRQSAYLKGSRNEANDALGYSVAISEDGSTIAAGAGEENCLVPGVNPAGCERSRVVPPGTPAPMGGSSGAGYVWARDGNTWTEQAFLKSSNPQGNDWFGVRMVLSGDGSTLVVSAQNEDSNARGVNGDQSDNSADEAGAVYIFTRSGSTWIQQAYLKAPNTQEFDEFGSALAIARDGRTLVVGARGEDGGAKGANGDQNDNSVDEAGAAYVFALN